MFSILKTSLTETFLEKFPDVEKSLNLYDKENSFADYFDMKRYNFYNTDTLNLRFPVYKRTGCKELEISFIEKITVSGATDITENPIPFVEGQNLLSSNIISQYLSLKPITIEITGKYALSRELYSNFIDEIQPRLIPINALAKSLNLPIVAGITDKINKATNKYYDVISEVSYYKNAIMGSIEAFRSLDEEHQNENIGKFLVSIIALRESRTAIDLDIGCFVFKNMAITNFLYDLKYDKNTSIVDVCLTFKNIVSYDNNVPDALKNELKKNENSGYASLIPYSIKKRIVS